MPGMYCTVHVGMYDDGRICMNGWMYESSHLIRILSFIVFDFLGSGGEGEVFRLLKLQSNPPF